MKNKSFFLKHELKIRERIQKKLYASKIQLKKLLGGNLEKELIQLPQILYFFTMNNSQVTMLK